MIQTEEAETNSTQSQGYKIWLPKFMMQKTIWGENEYIPIFCASDLTATNISALSLCEEDTTYNYTPSRFLKYLGRNLLPDNLRVEGKEEFPCVEPYTLSLPEDISGIDERTPVNADKFGLHGFCYDDVLMQKCRNISRMVKKAKRFHCAFGPNFSVPMDAYHCEAVEAIRLNRLFTVFLQRNGIPTIQTVSLTSAKFFDIAYDGLAPHCPISFENMCVTKDPQKKRLFRLAVDRLLEYKDPSMFVVVGNHLDFDPQVPVVYYESRIQKLRRHGYCK